MSPNGRRAWRRWAKKRLDIVDGFVSSAWLDVQYWNKWRRHRKSLNPHRTIGLLPPKPFTARSLVGMTMGARKRAARIDCFGIRTKVHDFRTLLRIGERLRPCPGCFDCAVECWVCHEPHDPPDELCGGSGVIRAGKLRPLLRKPDCGFYID